MLRVEAEDVVLEAGIGIVDVKGGGKGENIVYGYIDARVVDGDYEVDVDLTVLYRVKMLEISESVLDKDDYVGAE